MPSIIPSKGYYKNLIINISETIEATTQKIVSETCVLFVFCFRVFLFASPNGNLQKTALCGHTAWGSRGLFHREIRWIPNPAATFGVRVEPAANTWPTGLPWTSAVGNRMVKLFQTCGNSPTKVFSAGHELSTFRLQYTSFGPSK